MPGWFEDAFNEQNKIGEQDRDQYSDAHWQAWKAEEEKRIAEGSSANKNGNCPPNKPFTSRPGPDGRTECAFKPDDCPEGSHMWGSGAGGKCVADGSDPNGNNPNAAGGAGGQATPPKPAGAAFGTSGTMLQYGGNELQNTLINLFNQKGGIFGTNQPAAGATARTSGKAPVSGVALSDGGLWWGEGVDASHFAKGAAPVVDTGGGGGGKSEELKLSFPGSNIGTQLSGFPTQPTLPNPLEEILRRKYQKYETADQVV